MPSNIVDISSGETVVNRLIGLCEDAESVSLAVGFLFLDGLAPLMPQLLKIRKVQLLIGNVVNRLTEEQIHEGQIARTGRAGVSPDEMFAKGLREERDRAGYETALNLRNTIEGMPRTKANRSLIIDLATLIARGAIQVRLLTSCRLHAKAAIVTYPTWHKNAPGAAIVGSSNITFTASHIGEKSGGRLSPDIDVQVEGPENLNYLYDWFEAHWAEAQDFQKELFEELGQSWPLHSSATQP